MKKYLFILISFCLLLAGCSVGRYSDAKTVDNVAYLQFVNNHGRYPHGVQVYIDDNAPFSAKVNKQKKHTIKGNRYALNTGKRHIKVVADGKVLYNANVFLSIGETRQIDLP